MIKLMTYLVAATTIAATVNVAVATVALADNFGPENREQYRVSAQETLVPAGKPAFVLPGAATSSPDVYQPDVPFRVH